MLRWPSAKPSAVSAQRTSRTTEAAADCSLSPWERVRVRGRGAAPISSAIRSRWAGILAISVLTAAALEADENINAPPPVRSLGIPDLDDVKVRGGEAF